MAEVSMEIIKMVEEIFPQGDSRYNDFQAEEVISSFIYQKGIRVEKRLITGINVTKKEMETINGPQRLPKAIATRLLKEEEYSLIGYERRFMGGIADVLATNQLGKETIAVECYSCRTMKAIDYLEEENTTLWILPAVDEKEFLDNTFSLFILKRGPNWEFCLNEYKAEKLKRMREVIDGFDKSRDISTKTLKNVKSPRDE